MKTFQIREHHWSLAPTVKQEIEGLGYGQVVPWIMRLAEQALTGQKITEQKLDRILEILRSKTLQIHSDSTKISNIENDTNFDFDDYK
jgi:hypothetical protein